MNIAILGAGWLGLPLAKSLKQAGHNIKASVTKTSKLPILEQAGLNPYQVLFDPHFVGDASFFEDIDLLVLNIPPRRRPDIIEYHQAQIASVIQKAEASNIPKILFVSSTSVYPELNREVNEMDAGGDTKLSGKALIEVENMLRINNNFQTTVLRFAGLIGPDRLPGRFFAGKKDIPNGKAPVNLIHLDDCIGIINRIIETKLWGEMLQAAADIHPEKQIFYSEAAEQSGYELPSFVDELHSYKIISNSRLKKILDYEFLFPDPLQMI